MAELGKTGATGATGARGLPAPARRGFLAYLTLWVVLVGSLYWQYTDMRNTTNSLCALRDGLESRVAESEQFLKAHPNGIPGISKQDITRSIVNQKLTISALSALNC